MSEAKDPCCSGAAKPLEIALPVQIAIGAPLQQPPARDIKPAHWDGRYLFAVAVLALVWWLAYSNIQPLANWLVLHGLGMAEGSRLGAALAFFIYDTVKILLLLAALIYGIAWLRATLDMDRLRDHLAGRRRGLGYMLGALIGAVTPFCSCSSIPLFLGFTTARIPIGISMAFLITSPLINEVALVLLWGLLGWKFTLVYVLAGLSAGVIGGFVMDGLRAGRWLQPHILNSMNRKATACCPGKGGQQQVAQAASGLYRRHRFASDETREIFRRVWLWVVIGVAIGAALHGFVPDNWFAEHLGAGEWWTVPSAVLVAIPLYSNVTGIVPVMESLLLKGLPVGTTLAFCMSAVAASIPEVMMLRQIMTIRLQASFILYLWVIFTLIGWLLNLAAPFLL
jgi:uncharacterized membrane protein YraQ (UPF0718 family)